MHSKVRQVTIADASPLIALGRHNCLELLKMLYTHIIIPPAVKIETERHLSDSPGLESFRRSDWITIRNAANQDRVLYWYVYEGLHPGEAEAIALAEEQPSLLLIDEDEARKLLQAYPKITPITTCDVLLRAQDLGYLTDMCGLLSKMVKNMSLILARKVFEKYCPNYQPSPYGQRK